MDAAGDASSTSARGGQENKPPNSREWRQLFRRSLLIIAVYVAVTEYVYGHGLMRWGYIRALYFAAIIATSGGTGQVGPMNQSGRLFTVFYVPSTILIVGFAISEIAKAFKARQAARDKALTQALIEKLSGSLDASSDEGRGAGGAPHPRSPARERIALAVEIAKSVVPVVIVNLIGVTSIAMLEHWSTIDALYYAVVTSLTKGYGDVHPTRPVTYVIATLYIIAAVLCVGGGVSYVAEYMLRRRDELKRHDILHRPYAYDSIFDSKREHDATVSESEYCLHMLMQWGMVDPTLIAGLKKKFKEMDVNHDERLTREELARDAHALEAGLRPHPTSPNQPTQ